MPLRTPRPSPYLVGAGVLLLAAAGWAGEPRTTHASRLLSTLDGTVQGSRAVVIFQMGDCAGTRTELARWSTVVSPDPVPGAPTIHVEGVLVGPLPRDREQVRRILDEAGVTFPVHREGSQAAVALARSLGYERTPLVLIFDGDGRLSLAGPAAAMDPSELARRGLIPFEAPAVTS